MNKFFIGIGLVFSFVLGAVSTFAAVTTNYVSVSNPVNVEPYKATLSGTTASSSPAGSTVHVYFEYGTSSANLASSTPLQPLSSGSNVSGNELKKFTVTVDDLSPNTLTYFKIVRKVTPSSGTATYYRTTAASFRTPVLNLAPYVQSLTTKNINYVSSDCGVTSCTVEIPENLPSYTTILNIKKADPNNDSVTLSLKSGNTEGAFEITSSGNLAVNKKSALDFETNPEFNLVIELKDSGAGRLTSTYALKIKLKNIVDESAPLPPSYISTNNSQAPSYTHTSDRNVNYVSNNQSNVGKYTYRPNINTTEYKNTSFVDVKPYQFSNNRLVEYTSGNNTTVNSYANSSNNNGRNITPVYSNNNNITVNPYSNLGNTQRQALIQNLLAQLAVLQAELDRRIRLGIE